MPGRLGPRFAIEALFLIALAVGAAYADLAAKWIVVVMAGGWLVVALLELSADRIWAAAPPWRRPYYVPVPPPRAEPAAVEPAPVAVEPELEVAALPEAEVVALPEAEVVALPEPAREAAAEPAPAGEAAPAPQAEAVTTVIPPQEAEAGPEVEPEPEPEARPEPEPEPTEAAQEPEPEPEPAATEPARPKLEPLEPKPKRRWFRRREREPVAAEAPEIELPKHVRLLPPAERTDRSDAVAELFDVPEREEPTRR